MTRRDHGYVLQALYDLIGLHVNRRRGPVELPADELPAGVTARLALVWAAGQDVALLSGGAARGSAATQTARRELLSEAVDQARDVDVVGPLTVAVRCGRARHPFGSTPTGRLSRSPTLVSTSTPSSSPRRSAASCPRACAPCRRRSARGHRPSRTTAHGSSAWKPVSCSPSS